jgi:hypothetical protein
MLLVLELCLRRRPDASPWPAIALNSPCGGFPARIESRALRDDRTTVLLRAKDEILGTFGVLSPLHKLPNIAG